MPFSHALRESTRFRTKSIIIFFIVELLSNGSKHSFQSTSKKSDICIATYQVQYKNLKSHDCCYRIL